MKRTEFQTMRSSGKWWTKREQSKFRSSRDAFCLQKIQVVAMDSRSQLENKKSRYKD